MDNKFKITKPIRLIELFAGYGSQALALKYLGVPFEHWKISEWAVKSIQAYKDLHFFDDNTDYSEQLTVQEIRARLYGKISSDYVKPMSDERINRMAEKRLRTIYNNMQATHNLGSICTVKGSDLQITETDEYCYILTYSFPCQDLSVAGKGAGMAKDSGTRSGLLWEVERLLTECG
ncbi:MAG: DNA cytosine methyltransferase, partial [Clostridia bacterium]|nr:DNA cytosine methyltransferase [Clostridia bacterium]